MGLKHSGLRFASLGLISVRGTEPGYVLTVNAAIAFEKLHCAFKSFGFGPSWLVLFGGSWVERYACVWGLTGARSEQLPRASHFPCQSKVRCSMFVCG